MKTVERAFPLELTGEGGIVFPKDKQLHKLAVEFAERELASTVNFLEYHKIWLACEVDADGVPIKVTGMLGMVTRVDIPLVRFTGESAGELLIERARGYLEDQGGRGKEVFVYIADREEKSGRCPRWRRFLRAIGAKKSQRWSVTV